MAATTDGQRFPYVAVTNARGQVALRPMLPLVLANRGNTRSDSGLVDSGADVNVLPYALGVELGGVWEEQRTTVELSGNLARYPARGVIVSATVGHFPPVRLAFAWTRADNVPLVLGQVNFFAEFDVCFFRARRTFEVRLKRNEENDPARID